MRAQHGYEGDGQHELQQVSVTTVGTRRDTQAGMMSYRRRYITVAILFLVNLLNYMDRYTIAGVLTDVEDAYDIKDGSAGLLQAIFVVGFTLTAPLFGYAGDRYNRKWLMVGGVALWSLVTFAGSFVPGNQFWLFVLLRGIVGVGEASYVTIAPTLISDMFVKELRSSMLMIFYFAIPVGSGLGYIVGAYIAKAFDDWRWSLRLTPALGVVCCLLIAIVSRDPPRGMAEDGANHQSKSSLKQDVLALLKNKTFMLSTFGNTCVTFVAGALALFAPKFMLDAYHVSGKTNALQEEVSLYTGIVVTVAGILGVTLGTEIAKRVKRVYMNGDALVCATGLLASTPFLLIALTVCEYSVIPAWILILIGESLVFMNWPVIADMVLYTVPATMRSTAQAVQLFICHILGDAASPYLLGAVSDSLRKGNTETYVAFKSLQSSLYVTLFVTVLGGGFFLACSLYVVKDKDAAETATKATAVRPPATSAPRHQLEQMEQSLPLDDMIPLLDDDFDTDGESGNDGALVLLT